MECIPKKHEDGVPNLLKLFEKAKLEENAYSPAMLSAIQRLPTDVSANSEPTEEENMFVDDKDEEELTMILSNSGKTSAQAMQNVMDEGIIEATGIRVIKSGEYATSTINQRSTHHIIRRPYPGKTTRSDRNEDVQKVNSKGLLSQLRSDELCTFLAAALTSAAAVRKLPKSTSPGLALPCRTGFNNNSSNNDTNNNNTYQQPKGGTWCGGSADFRSPPCKRVKLHNRPCLDFEKMHKQKACSSFQSGRPTSNWKSTTNSNLLYQKNQKSNSNIINISNNSTWGLAKLDPSLTSCPQANLASPTNQNSLPMPELTSTFSSSSPTQQHFQVETDDRDESSISNTDVCNQVETDCTFGAMSATRTNSLQICGAFVSTDTSNGIGRISKHQSNPSTRGFARYNHLHHSNNNSTPIFGPTWHYGQQALPKECLPGEDRVVPHRRTKPTTPHHLKVISNSSNLDLRHLNSVIGSSGGRQSFVPICFPAASVPSPGASGVEVGASVGDTAMGVGLSPNCSSLFSVGSNFRSLCTAGTQ